MRDSIHKYFQVGTIHFMSYPETMKGEGPVEETLRKLLVDDYFDTVEISWIKNPAVRARVRAMLHEAGVKVCYGAQPRLLTTGLNPNAVKETERAMGEATLLEAIDEAEELGAQGIAFLAGKYEEAQKEKAFAQLVKTTKTLCDYAKTKGMNVELEVFDYDVDKRALIGPAPLAKRFAEEVNGLVDNFGLLIDLSHFPLTRENSSAVVNTLAPFVTHLHFGSAVAAKASMEAYGDMHPRFNFPNSANHVAELTDYLRCLREAGFFRPTAPLALSFEVKPWKSEDPDLVLANTKRVLNRAWALLED